VRHGEQDDVGHIRSLRQGARACADPLRQLRRPIGVATADRNVVPASRPLPAEGVGHAAGAQNAYPHRVS